MHRCVSLALMLALALGIPSLAFGQGALPPDVQSGLDGVAVAYTMGLKKWQGTIKVVTTDPASKKKEVTTCKAVWNGQGKPQFSEVVSDNSVMKQMIDAGKRLPFFCDFLPYYDLRGEISEHIPNWGPFDVKGEADPRGGRKVVGTLRKPPAPDDPTLKAAGASYVAGVEMHVDKDGKLTRIRRRHQTKGGDGKFFEEWVTTEIKYYTAKNGFLPTDITSGCEGKGAGSSRWGYTCKLEYGEADNVKVLKRITRTMKDSSWVMDVTGVSVEKRE